MRYAQTKDKLIFDERLPKIKNGIKVYFTRDGKEKDQSDFPCCYADTNGDYQLDFVDGYLAFEVWVKKRILFGLLGTKWVKLDKID